MRQLVIPRSVEPPGLTRLQPVGQLTHTSASQLGRAITKALLDTGWVLVDLDRLHIEQPSRALVFTAALADAGGWPQARLVLYRGGAETVRTLTASNVIRTVPHARTAEAAAGLLTVRPPVVRRRAFLERQPVAPALARDLVAHACTAWRVSDNTTYWARLVISELVTNAIEHAHTPCHVVVEFTGTRLSLSTIDGSHEPPVEQPQDLAAEHGRGLQIIADLADRWGVTHRNGHKTTWANMTTVPRYEASDCQLLHRSQWESSVSSSRRAIDSSVSRVSRSMSPVRVVRASWTT